jgi:pyridoxal phosphate enzyme (YggS family)
VIADALASARRRIDRAAEVASRDPAGIRLVAVTKTVSASRVEEALRAGVTDVGENRVQEALAKQPSVCLPARWHLIGHLQSNKARPASSAFDAVDSVDSLRVAEALSRHRPEAQPPLGILVEVDLTGIAGRAGVAPDGLAELVRSVAVLPGIQLGGLMTIAPMGPAPEAARPFFASLRILRDQAEQQTGVALPELSMGMSDDFEVAIQEGATTVRLGRAIFGRRPLS